MGWCELYGLLLKIFAILCEVMKNVNNLHSQERVTPKAGNIRMSLSRCINKYGKRVFGILAAAGIIAATGCKQDEEPNSTPVFGDFSREIDVQEGQPIGAVLTTIEATDADGNELAFQWQRTTIGQQILMALLNGKL